MTLLENTQYFDIPEVTPKKNKLPVLLGIGVGALGVTLGLVLLIRTQQKPIALPAESVESSILAENATQPGPNQQKSTVPTTPQVAGAEAAQQPSTTSDFGVVSAAADRASQATPALGTSGVCSPGELFSIGEPEKSKLDNPTDEFNWGDALDNVAEYENPFVVNRNATSEFPWRTTTDNPATIETSIIFNYAGTPGAGQLLLGWSPGKLGEKAKRVLLDGILVGTTPTHTGQLTSGWWEQMPRFVDTLPLMLSTGEHTLTIQHTADQAADPAVWDFITLNLATCQ